MPDEDARICCRLILCRPRVCRKNFSADSVGGGGCEKPEAAELPRPVAMLAGTVADHKTHVRGAEAGRHASCNNKAVSARRLHFLGCFFWFSFQAGESK